MTSPLSSDIQQVIDSSVSDDIKIDFLESHVGDNNAEDLKLVLSEEYKILVQLIRIDSILGTEENNKIEALFKEIHNSNIVKNGVFNTNNYIQTYIKIKFNDLYGDYQFLVKAGENKIFELINKKTLLLSTIPNNYIILRNAVNYKLLQLLIISRYDFRRANLVSFVHENTNYNEIDPVAKDIFIMVLNKKIIPVEKYRQFIYQIKENSAIKRIPSTILFSNLLENNIYNLSNYYKSIKIAKIHKILNIEDDGGIEKIIFKMILSDRLPVNTKIDQENDLLIFGDTSNEDYNSLNMHIKEVSELINNINTNIIAGQ